MAESSQTFFPPEQPQYDSYNVAPTQFFYDKGDSYVTETSAMGYIPPDAYTDPAHDYSWMEGQAQAQVNQTFDPRFQDYNQFNQFGYQGQTQAQMNMNSASPQVQSESPMNQAQVQSESPMNQVQTASPHSPSPMPQASPMTASPAQSPAQTTSQAQTTPQNGPPPKFINGEEYHFVPGLGYYPVARIPALRQHQQQAAQNIQHVEPQVMPVKAPPKPKAVPKAPPKRKLDPTAQAAGAVTAQVKKRTASDIPEGDPAILEKVADNPDVADIVRQTFVQLQEQREAQAKVAFSAARLLLSVPEARWGKNKPDLMALCLSNCYRCFSGDKYHDFWRAMRRFQNFIVRLRAWMVFNVNKRLLDECTHALDFLVVMRLSHDTLLQFKFDKVLKKIIKLGAPAEIEKSNTVLNQAAQTVKADESSASPVAASTTIPEKASSSAVTAAIAAAKAKSGKAKAAPKPAAAGSFFKSLSKPEPKEDKKDVKEVKEVKEVKKEVKEVKEVKEEPKKEKPPPSAFNDVMANILRVPAKRASPAAAAPVEAKKQKTKKKVSWRPDEELVDVRYFESEKDENRNHHLSSYRDMDKEEGRGLIGNNSEVDIDFDAVEDEQQEWYEPVKLSFGGVEDEIEPNPPKRGGKGEIESSEAETMAQKNKTSLATVYEADDDIPDSPVEPSEASQNPMDLPDSLLSEPKEMVVAERTKKMLGIMSGAYRVVPKQAFKGDPTDENVCEAYDTVFVGETAPEKPAEQPAAPAVPAFDISKLPGFSSVSSTTSESTPPPPPPPGAAANPLAALAALPGLIPALQAAANPATAAQGLPPIPGLPPGVDPMAFVQALAQMQQQQQQAPQHSQSQPQHHQHEGYNRNNRYDRNDRNDRGNVNELRKRDVRPEIARSWDKLPSNRYSQPCRFFNTDKACSRGDQCIFLHLPRN
ncbi:hypothetical protein CJU89_2892 [Yarrowia sp. B02]|nr:hypothetical protein CJU89_2892 [Yarrowia sp. B02]